MYHRRVARDVAAGEHEEQRLLPLFRKAFGDDTLAKTGPRDAFDFANADKSLFVELKCLSTPKDRYASHMLHPRKVAFARATPGARFVVIYKFGDGAIECCELTEDTEIEVKPGGRWDRGADEPQMYCYLPNRHFRPLFSDAVGAGGA